MTREEATNRIVLSRHTLARYRMMPELPGPYDGNAKLVADEISYLREIAQRFPEKAASLAQLCNQWQEFGALLRGKMH